MVGLRCAHFQIRNALQHTNTSNYVCCVCGNEVMMNLIIRRHIIIHVIDTNMLDAKYLKPFRRSFSRRTRLVQRQSVLRWPLSVFSTKCTVWL